MPSDVLTSGLIWAPSVGGIWRYSFLVRGPAPEAKTLQQETEPDPLVPLDRRVLAVAAAVFLILMALSGGYGFHRDDCISSTPPAICKVATWTNRSSLRSWPV